MKRSLIALAAGLALLTVACGGDKKPASGADAPTERTAATTPAPGETAAATKTASKGKTATPKASTASGKTVSGLLGSIFGNALGSPQTQSAGTLGEGDPALLELLPPNSALPDGYTPVGAYTFRAPDGISETGGIDMAAEIAIAGNPAAASGDTPDFSKVGILMALVMKPDDLQSLGEAFDAIRDLDEEDLQDALAGAEGLNGIFAVENVRVFETDGLGDGNAGIEMTIDMSGLGSLFGGLGAAEEGAPDLTELKLTMRLYLFARGDYAGGLLRMAFTDELSDDFDEVALAKLVDDKLKTAP